MTQVRQTEGTARKDGQLSLGILISLTKLTLNARSLFPRLKAKPMLRKANVLTGQDRHADTASTDVVRPNLPRSPISAVRRLCAAEIRPSADRLTKGEGNPRHEHLFPPPEVPGNHMKNNHYFLESLSVKAGTNDHAPALRFWNLLTETFEK